MIATASLTAADLDENANGIRMVAEVLDAIDDDDPQGHVVDDTAHGQYIHVSSGRRRSHRAIATGLGCKPDDVVIERGAVDTTVLTPGFELSLDRLLAASDTYTT